MDLAALFFLIVFFLGCGDGELCWGLIDWLRGSGAGKKRAEKRRWDRAGTVFVKEVFSPRLRGWMFFLRDLNGVGFISW